MLLKRSFFNILLVLSLISFSCEDLILGPEPEDTPVNNFDILWGEFDRYYPSFIVRNINWDSLYTVYRSRITPQTTDGELWEIISELLYNLDDLHVYMYNRGQTELFNASHSFGKRIGEFSLELIEHKYLKNNYNTTGDGNLVYGRLADDSVGYIYIKTFHGNLEWVKDINNIISEFSDVSSIIIDVRDNNGGILDNVDYLASSFVNRNIIYLQMLVRNGIEHNQFSDPVFHSVGPRLNLPNFSKRTVLLTNKETASGSELFALVFKHLDYSIQIGDSTAGGICATHRDFQLLNGWTYYMPSVLGLTEDGQCLENIGVVPDIYKRNTFEEIHLYDYDRILEYAILHLSR